MQPPRLTGFFALHGGVFASLGANLELAPQRVFVFELTGAGLDASPPSGGEEPVDVVVPGSSFRSAGRRWLRPALTLNFNLLGIGYAS